MYVSDLIAEIRKAINDPNALEFSNEELLELINEAQGWIVNGAINQEYLGFVKSAELSLTDSKAALPPDFVREYAVLDAGGTPLYSLFPSDRIDEKGYAIVGKELHSGADKVKLFYFYMPPRYLDVSEEISIPDLFIPVLKEAVISLALNRIELTNDAAVRGTLMSNFEARVAQIVSNMGRAYNEIRMPL